MLFLQIFDPNFFYYRLAVLFIRFQRKFLQFSDIHFLILSLLSVVRYSFQFQFICLILKYCLILLFSKILSVFSCNTQYHLLKNFLKTEMSLCMRFSSSYNCVVVRNIKVNPIMTSLLKKTMLIWQ